MFSILVGIFYPFAEAVFSKEGVFQQPRLVATVVAVEKLLDRNVFLAAIIAAAEFVLLPSAR